MGELHPEAARYHEVSLDDELDRDLGLDSLARMELLTRLEKEFTTRLPEKILISVETPRELLHHLKRTTVTAVRQTLEPVPPVAGTAGERVAINLDRITTLPDILDCYATAHPDTEHIRLLTEDGETAVSYGRLQQQARILAGQILRLGLEQGSTIAIMLPTSTDYFFTFFGILYGGGIPVPLYPPARPTQIEEHVRRHTKILENAGATILVTIPEIRPVARLLMGQVTCLQRIITPDELLSGESVDFSLKLQSKDMAFLQYTSGSTGDPKGVALSHANLLANIRAMGRVCRVTADDVFVSWLPLYHDMGLIGAWLGSLYFGCRLVIMPPLSFLARPVSWLKTIDRFRGTLSASPNFGYELCCARIDEEELEGLDLSSWRRAFNGAEPVIPASVRRFTERFSRYGLAATTMAPVYGLAESSVGLAFPRFDEGFHTDRVDRDHFAASGEAVPAAPGAATIEFVNCGRPLPNHQVRVIDNGGRELPERWEGRLQFKGPSSTSGYFHNALQTRKLFDGDWLDSGDLAYISQGGIYITSRIKDIIIKGGRNIYPHELEDAVNAIPGVRKGCSAVFGATDRHGGTEQLVVLTETRTTAADNLARLKQQIVHTATDLTGYPPDHVIIARPGTVLKTSSGKIRRSACRQLFENGLLEKKQSGVYLQITRMSLAGAMPSLRRFYARLSAIAYAWYCWTIFALACPPIWALVMLLPASRCRAVCADSARVLLRLAGIKIMATGQNSIKDAGKVILASNHMSYLDAIVLTATLPLPCSFVAKSELARAPLLGPALKKLGVFFVDRFDPVQGLEDTRRIEEGIHQGCTPLFFVEGTLKRMPGLLPFQMGAFVLAARERLPIVSITIRGTRNILRDKTWFPRRGTVRITINPPLFPAGREWKDAIELKDRVRSKMLDQVGEPDLAGEYTSLQQLGRGPSARQEQSSDTTKTPDLE